MSREEMAQRIRRAAGHTADSDAPARFDRADLAERTVLAFDPSLSGTGWALMMHNETALQIVNYGTYTYTDGLSGPELEMRAADVLFENVLADLHKVRRHHPEAEVTTECPPTGNTPGKGRTESSWLACRAIRDAALVAGLTVRPMVPIQRHKKLTTGTGNADKKLVGLCLGLLAVSLPIVGYPTRTNNNVRDAVCVGLADLHGGER